MSGRHLTSDIIIIGAGLAGLYVASNLAKRYPHRSIFVIEKYDYLGGRIVSYNKGGYHWEIGAGRIASSHRLVRALMEKYGLTYIPISNDSTNIPQSLSFEDLLDTFILPAEELGPDILARYTLADILSKLVSKSVAEAILKKYPYWSEVHRMRADMALQSFRNEMGKSETFGVCKEGLSALTDRLAEDCRRQGVVIHLNTEVSDIDNQTVICRKGSLTYSAPTIIVALHSDAIQKLPTLASEYSNILKHLVMEPLVRMYAVFPKDMSDILQRKVITPGRLRYIIPINARRGVIMISYTDGDDARYWMRMQARKGDKAVADRVMQEFRTLFPDTPDPILFKIYPWTAGCTYWVPGNYDPKKESKYMLHPRRGLYFCGESFSLKQAWMEGALENAEQMLTLF